LLAFVIKCAITRKNALFADNDRGGDHWATIASLIKTCKLNGIDPQSYLSSIITYLVNCWSYSKFDELIP
jgi:transposase